MQIASRTGLSQRVADMSRELKLFAVASLVLGMAFSMFDATFNNFLNDQFTLTGFQRSFLEFPRELPGFSVVFISALLWFLCSRRLGALSLALAAVGALLIGFLSTSYGVMVLWLFIFSTGQHLFMPVASTVGMQLAKEGKIGQRLGQLNAIRNLAAIMGSFVVMLGFRYLNFDFEHVFAIAAVCLAVAAGLMFTMKRDRVQPASTHLALHKEYKVFYLLAVLYGSRKQLFITFAPWVLVTVFNQPTQTLATLWTVGGVIGILFQPLLGWTIDRYGERFVLMTEAVLLIVVCIGYGFARSIFPESVALVVVFLCFLLDQMLMSVGMARSTYIRKIALEPGHVQPALTASVTIDHIFSISIALLGGVIWNKFGFQYVFLMGAVIAIFNFFVAMRVQVPEQAPANAS